jgi:hypothetical protein
MMIVIIPQTDNRARACKSRGDAPGAPHTEEFGERVKSISIFVRHAERPQCLVGRSMI